MTSPSAALSGDHDRGPTLPRRLEDARIERRPVRGSLSIVIPTLGRPILESCLASIAAGDAWPARVIVIDQSSSEEVAIHLRGLEESGMTTLYLPSSQRGRSAGVNCGLEQVETRFVAITDDD